jgi:hypothetical protein
MSEYHEEVVRLVCVWIFWIALFFNLLIFAPYLLLVAVAISLIISIISFFRRLL